MTRELTNHKVNGLNEALKIEVCDDPGPGGANHNYAISFLDERYEYQRSPISDAHNRNCLIIFQNGPIQEAGVNGISQEALLAIVEDRLVGFQSGQYATTDNAEALDHVRKAMDCLHRRTRERVARGVEGTNVK